MVEQCNLTEDQFYELWSKRWLRANGRMWPGGHFMRLMLAIDCAKAGMHVLPNDDAKR
jgi:hypothetical protein